MSIRILHTADNHIGLRFGGRAYPASVKAMLVTERFNALERAVSVANERKAHCIVVAGDLFDSQHTGHGDVKRTADILNRFEGLAVVVLPGNHDFYEVGDNSLWPVFRNAMGDRLLHLLDRPEPLSLDLGERTVIFYPAPCTAKHSDTHAIGWVSAIPKPPGALHIGVAHGSVTGVSPDLTDKYFPMDEESLRKAGVDFWLLGHTHIRYPAQPSTSPSLFYIPSTHTPDGFDCAHEGYVWFLDVDENNRVAAESVRTGKLRFVDAERTVNSAGDLERCREDLKNYDLPSTLLKLTLKGRLSEEDMARMNSMAEGLEKEFLFTEISRDGVALHITSEHVDREFSADSFPHRLLSALASEPGDTLAMQLAYELIREAKK